jgi:uncharacterized MAPEG superfamily protein
MHLVYLVATVALVQYLVFGALVGRARGQYGVRAPAVTGHEMFERYYRVQMNTLELLVPFLPALVLAGQYWSARDAAGLGVVYLVGRTLYAVAYIREPAKRGLGHMLSLVPVGMLLVAVLVKLVPMAFN